MLNNSLKESWIKAAMVELNADPKRYANALRRNMPLERDYQTVIENAIENRLATDSRFPRSGALSNDEFFSDAGESAIDAALSRALRRENEADSDKMTKNRAILETLKLSHVASFDKTPPSFG